MIITIANGSGGSAKSILTDNLAALRALAGHKVIVLDNDPGHTSLSWSSERRLHGHCPPVAARSISGKGLQPELENLSCHYHDILIDTESRDCMGSRSALLAAHVALIAIDLENLAQFNEAVLINRIQIARQTNPDLRILVVMTSTEKFPASMDKARIQNFVQQIPAAQLFPGLLHSTAALHCAFQGGLSVSEYLPADHAAISEMQDLFSEVFAIPG
ncbi:cobyrinic acid ac-diamide synthase [Undibacterium sp. TJN19]|uniref:nucleotide-binding protein n=1 Tax=Undibacterium sp. TJN19 TaxID=3413055 RepID=UPI003BF43FA2